MSGLDDAKARVDAASEAASVACRAQVAALDELLAASAEYQRLHALSMPLRDWLLAEFDGAVRRSRPATPRQLAPRAHRDAAEIKVSLEDLADEGLVRRVRNGYDALGGYAS